MQKVIDRIKLIFKEIGNLLTNIIVPLVPILMIILETVGVSDNVLAKVKQ